VTPIALSYAYYIYLHYTMSDATKSLFDASLLRDEDKADIKGFSLRPLSRDDYDSGTFMPIYL
jgi:hypothetical protein